jgi:3-phenylpropionate/trans-cinnamate dioxygenase ferredoxin subunit
MSFFEITTVDQIPDSQMKMFTLQGKPILIANVHGQYCAIGGKCTHMGGDLSKGQLEGAIVKCPRHGSRFDVTTGANVSGPKMGFLKLKTADEPKYNVKVEGNRIQVEL